MTQSTLERELAQKHFQNSKFEVPENLQESDLVNSKTAKDFFNGNNGSFLVPTNLSEVDKMPHNQKADEMLAFFGMTSPKLVTLSANGEAVFCLSDESLNSYGYRVLTKGIDLSRFLKNPIMFYNHASDKGVIGKWKDVRIENGKLLGVPIFDTNDNFAKTIKSKVLQGFISACSIGFRVLAISEDKKDMVSGQKYPTITKSELYEVSLVDIPSNANAVKLRFEDNSLKHKFGL